MIENSCGNLLSTNFLLTLLKSCEINLDLLKSMLVPFQIMKLIGSDH